MSQIGTLTASSSDIFDRPDTPANILIGTVDTDVPLSSLSISVRGNQTINITAQNRIQAFAKFMMSSVLGADVKIGMLIKLAEEAITGQSCQIRTTNAGATTPGVFEFSTGKNPNSPSVVACGEETIQASSNQRFEGNDFDFIAFDPSNVTDLQFEFLSPDGSVYSEQLTAVEVDALFVASGNATDADGRLAGLCSIDNRQNTILSVTVYNGSGGTTTLLKTVLG